MKRAPSLRWLVLSFVLSIGTGAAQAAPSVQFKAPSSGGTMTGTYADSASCEVTGANIARVIFYMDGTLLNTESYAPWQCKFDSAKFANGTHTLKAVAYDSASAQAQASIPISINNVSAPTVQFKAPTSGGTMTGSYADSALCEVTGKNIARVIFYMDATLLNTEGYAPWQCKFDSTKFANGAHTLKAAAYDSAGVRAEASIQVSVLNGTTGGTGGTGGTGSSLIVSVAGGGTVTSSGGTQNVACTNTGSGTPACTGVFPAGSTATLTATPAAGYSLRAWLSNAGGVNAVTSCSSAAPGPCTFVKATGTQFVTAIFSPTGGPAPLLLYSDITSGPVGCTTNCGLYAGENNKGIYLSLFGKNFGTSGAGSRVKAYLNNVEVTRYMVLGPSKGRPDIQQLSLQLGSLDQPVVGRSLPIMLVVDGRIAANPNRLAFIVNRGRIFFVDNVRGSDTSDVVSGGTFAAPFATVQRKSGQSSSFSIASASTSGAWGRVQAGDFIVVRGSGASYSRQGFDNFFLKALNKSGSAPGGAPACSGCTGSGPITLMGYPGEDVFVNGYYESARDSGTISSADSARIAEGKGHYINIVGLRIEGGNHDGAVNTQAGGSNWRVVNNEITAASAVNNSSAKAGGIAGRGNAAVPGPGQFFAGNYIHDVFNGPDNGTSAFENHGVYVEGGAGYEIAYNRIARIRGGNGIQTYTSDGTYVDNVSIHHNLIQNVGKHALNLAAGTRANFAIWNNVILDIDRAAIRFNSSATSNARIHNNTIRNVNRVGSGGAVLSDVSLSGPAVDMRNNIVVPVRGAYASLANGLPGTVTDNLWYGGSGTNPAFTFSVNSLTADPMFVSVSAGLEDFHLRSGSPAINSGTAGTLALDDYDAARTGVTSRPAGGGFDMGAYEQ